MKKKLISLILAVATTFGAISISTPTTAKAESFDKIYQSAYDCASKLNQIGKEYNITPRLKNNGSKMEDNDLKNVVASSGRMQKTIDELRFYQHQFPDAYWKARNTFSEIGDGYQQPIYEWIVEIAIDLQKSLKEVNNIQKEKLEGFIKEAEYKLNSANILNKGVDPAYKGAYQATLDEIATNLKKIKENLGTIETGWVLKNNHWFYLDNKGKITVGWTLINHKCYFFDNDGTMKIGWQPIKSKNETHWFYLKPSGERAEGFEKINNTWYFFDTEMGEMKTGWVGLCHNKDGKLTSITYDKPNGQAGFTFYYMDKSGVMLTGSKNINGILYNFRENGALISKN